jgi:hypothetical protein
MTSASHRFLSVISPVMWVPSSVVSSIEESERASRSRHPTCGRNPQATASEARSDGIVLSSIRATEAGGMLTIREALDLARTPEAASV